MDKSKCPLCNRLNNCKAKSINNDCWCLIAHVPKDLIERTKRLNQDPSCICQSCINQYDSELDKIEMSNEKNHS
ncbi:MAG: hypothetical protein ACJA0E_000212 [Bermanella sp.]|jgi:hypothetical protein